LAAGGFQTVLMLKQGNRILNILPRKARKTRKKNCKAIFDMSKHVFFFVFFAVEKYFYGSAIEIKKLNAVTVDVEALAFINLEIFLPLKRTTEMGSMPACHAAPDVSRPIGK
jgi:hypothetical protein